MLVPFAHPRGTGALLGAGVEGIPAAVTFGATAAFVLITGVANALR